MHTAEFGPECIVKINLEDTKSSVSVAISKFNLLTEWAMKANWFDDGQRFCKSNAEFRSSPTENPSIRRGEYSGGFGEHPFWTWTCLGVDKCGDFRFGCGVSGIATLPDFNKALTSIALSSRFIAFRARRVSDLWLDLWWVWGSKMLKILRDLWCFLRCFYVRGLGFDKRQVREYNAYSK